MSRSTHTPPESVKKHSPRDRAELVTDTTKDIPLDKKIIVGISENIGKRPFQEDAITYAANKSVSDFAAMPLDVQEQVMTTAFLELHQALAKHPKSDEMGTCACVATGSVDKVKANVSVSYVGDSVAYLVVLDKDNNLKLSQACNPALHDGNNQKELAEIRAGTNRAQYADMEVGGRVGGVAVTRALGDKNSESVGLSHDPQTVKISCPVEKTDKIFMVVTCDGAMEYLKKSKAVAEDYASDLGKDIFERTLRENPHATPSEIARIAVKHALAKDVGDNVSVVVTPLKFGQDPVMTAVFDGHNGYALSQRSGDTFNHHFDDAVRLHQLLDDTKHRPLPFIKAALNKMLHDQPPTLMESTLLDAFIKNLHQQINEMQSKGKVDVIKRAELYFMYDKLNEIRSDYHARQDQALAAKPPVAVAAAPAEAPKLDKRAMMMQQKTKKEVLVDSNPTEELQRATLNSLYDCLNQSKADGSLLRAVKQELEDMQNPKSCMDAISAVLKHAKVPDKDITVTSSKLHKADPGILIKKLIQCLDKPHIEKETLDAIQGALRQAFPAVSPRPSQKT